MHIISIILCARACAHVLWPNCFPAYTCPISCGSSSILVSLLILWRSGTSNPLINVKVPLFHQVSSAWMLGWQRFYAKSTDQQMEELVFPLILILNQVKADQWTSTGYWLWTHDLANHLFFSDDIAVTTCLPADLLWRWLFFNFRAVVATTKTYTAHHAMLTVASCWV